MERTVERSSSSQSLMGQLCQPNIFEICEATTKPADDNIDVVSRGPFWVRYITKCQ